MNFERLKESHLKRNIIIGVIAVLIISTAILNFTRAKYRVTQSIPLVNGTINYTPYDFKIIAMYRENDTGEYEEIEIMPSSGYTINEEKSYCEINGEKDNNAKLYTNNVAEHVIANLQKGSKCYVYFNKKNFSSLIETMENLYRENSSTLAYDETADNNLRYIGANPNNYVYFNCEDYNNPSSSTCELWRIIGIFNENSHGISGEKLVKLIRKDMLGKIAWNDIISNEWSEATLQLLLNGDYLKSNGDYEFTGIKNETTRNMIQTVTWRIGGTSGGSSENDSYTSHWYIYERGINVYSGNTTRWTGKIALMYPSDYGYATNGGISKNRTACLQTGLYFWRLDENSDCKINNWLYDSTNTQWTLTPQADGNVTVSIIDESGWVVRNSAGASTSVKYSVRPTLYFSTRVSISRGTGTEEDPYTLVYD